MLFVITKTGEEVFRLIEVLGGKEEKAALLVQDAVLYATPVMTRRLRDLGVEAIYAAEDAVKAEDVNPSPEVLVVDYDEMATLIMDDYDRVLSV